MQACPMQKTPATVDAYVAARPEPVQRVLERLRALVRETWPDAEERMKWGAPVYAAPSGEALIYLYGGRDHANLGFVRGAEIGDPGGLLEGSGKSGRHVKCWPDRPLPEAVLADLIRRSAALA